MALNKNLINLGNVIFVLILFSFISCSKTTKLTNSEPPSNFNKLQKELVNAGIASTPMRVFKTNNPSDSILLRTKSDKVDFSFEDKELQLFIDRLLTTVKDSISLGVGIAAPQVGILKNIIWVQRFDKENFPFEAYINPVITHYSERKQDCMEGCLSIPNKQAMTKTRAFSITIEYDKRDGSHHTEQVEDFTAVIFQHEIDHLHGKLFIDYLEE